MNTDYKPTNIGKKTFEYFENEATEEEKKEYKRFHEMFGQSSYI